jgi:hypothetical protein
MSCKKSTKHKTRKHGFLFFAYVGHLGESSSLEFLLMSFRLENGNFSLFSANTMPALQMQTGTKFIRTTEASWCYEKSQRILPV